jgi:hypothetical protein
VHKRQERVLRLADDTGDRKGRPYIIMQWIWWGFMKKIIIALMVCVSLSGCFVKAFLGIRTDQLDHCKIRGSYAVADSREQVYEKMLTTLKGKDIFVYAKKKQDALYGRGFNAIFPPCLDTTDAGIFFADENGQTIITVSSYNDALVDFFVRDFLPGMFPVNVVEEE